jgi:hypothetical protein
MPGIERGRAALLAMLALLAASGMPLSAVRAELFTFADRSIQLDMPRGWCRVDPKKANNAEFLHKIETMQQGRNQVVMVFADCQQLGAAHSGTFHGFFVTGIIMMPLDGGKVVPASSSDRAQFAAEAARALGMVDLDKMRGELRERFARAGAAGIDVDEIKSLGVLKKDEIGVYPGFLMPAAPPSTIKSAMSINALTMINQLPVSVVISRPLDRPGVVDALLAEEREILRGLIAANASIEAAAPKPAPGASAADRSAALRMGLIVVMIALTLCLAGFVTMRWRGREADQI